MLIKSKFNLTNLQAQVVEAIVDIPSRIDHTAEEGSFTSFFSKRWRRSRPRLVWRNSKQRVVIGTTGRRGRVREWTRSGIGKLIQCSCSKLIGIKWLSTAIERRKSWLLGPMGRCSIHTCTVGDKNFCARGTIVVVRRRKWCLLIILTAWFTNEEFWCSLDFCHNSLSHHMRSQVLQMSLELLQFFLRKRFAPLVFIQVVEGHLNPKLMLTVFSCL